jgi:hypothetical protein
MIRAELEVGAFRNVKRRLVRSQGPTKVGPYMIADQARPYVMLVRD